MDGLPTGAPPCPSGLDAVINVQEPLVAAVAEEGGTFLLVVVEGLCGEGKVSQGAAHRTVVRLGVACAVPVRFACGADG